MEQWEMMAHVLDIIEGKAPTKKSSALVCENCKMPMATVLSDSSVGVGDQVRTKTTVNRYCGDCQKAFVDFLRGAG